MPSGGRRLTRKQAWQSVGDHLAAALGREAVRLGYSVLFVQATALVTALARAHAEGRLDDRLAFYAKPKLLVVDELGYPPSEANAAHLFFYLPFEANAAHLFFYLPFEANAAHLLFQLVADRHA